MGRGLFSFLFSYREVTNKTGHTQAFAPQFSVMAREYNLWGCSGLFKRNVERHSESFGNALQLLYRDIFLTTADGVQVLLTNAQTGCQFCFTHVFFNIAFFKSIFVFFCIIVVVSLKFMTLCCIKNGPTDRYR